MEEGDDDDVAEVVAVALGLGVGEYGLPVEAFLRLDDVVLPPNVSRAIISSIWRCCRCCCCMSAIVFTSKNGIDDAPSIRVFMNCVGDPGYKDDVDC